MTYTALSTLETVSHSRAKLRLAAILMVLSGFAALSYQIIWTNQSALWLGHETASAFAVVGAFFGGLALGAFALGSPIDRSRSPALWYVGCELVIAVWCVSLALLLQPFSELLLRLIGPHPSPVWHWGVAFLGTFVILLPATAAMGATLPAMERMMNSTHDARSSLPWLYAANTAGAVLGVIACAFVLIPTFGLRLATLLCALLNLACAVIAWLISSSPPATVRAPSTRTDSRVLYALAMTGLLGIGYEVLAVRALSQVAENTVYTFALLLAVYLVGTAAGAAAYGRWLLRATQHDSTRNLLLYVLVFSCLLGALGMSQADALKAFLLDAFGNTMNIALAAEAVLAIVAFLLPTMTMGALFTHLSVRGRADGIAFGTLLGVNLLGAAVAPALFGALLIMEFGTQWTLILVALGYLLLVSRRKWTSRWHWATVGAAALLVVLLPSFSDIYVHPNSRLVDMREGALGTVSVVEDTQGVASMHINNRQQEGSSATRFADGRQALLPILLHPGPKRALLLGVGTGVTASVAASTDGLDVDAVELLPEVIELTQYFIDQQRLPRLTFTVADARRFVRANQTQYDVIIADNFHPARTGSALLYTVEHFRAIKSRLTPNGVFCQWLPLHQLDIRSLRSIVRSFIVEYPNAFALLATNSLDTPVIGLIALGNGGRLDIADAHAHMARAQSSPGVAEFGIVDELTLLGNFVAGPQSLARFGESEALNTDDRPIIAYRAPKITYEPDSEPRDRLVAFLRAVEVTPRELLNVTEPSPANRWDSRLAPYWRARDRFIEVGRDVRPTNDVHRMLAQVRAPLLAVLRVSPDFRPAYDPLLRMAAELAQTDVPAARALLTELKRVSPARVEAADYLIEIGDVPQFPSRTVR